MWKRKNYIQQNTHKKHKNFLFISFFFDFQNREQFAALNSIFWFNILFKSLLHFFKSLFNFILIISTLMKQKW